MTTRLLPHRTLSGAIAAGAWLLAVTSTSAAPVVLDSSRVVDANVRGLPDSALLLDTSGVTTSELSTSASLGEAGATATHSSRIDALGFSGSGITRTLTGLRTESAASGLGLRFTLATDHAFTGFLTGEVGFLEEFDPDTATGFSGLFITQDLPGTRLVDRLATAPLHLDFINERQLFSGVLAAGTYVFGVGVSELGSGLGPAGSTYAFGIDFADLGVVGPPAAVPLPGTASLAIAALGLMAGVSRSRRPQAGSTTPPLAA